MSPTDNGISCPALGCDVPWLHLRVERKKIDFDSLQNKRLIDLQQRCHNKAENTQGAPEIMMRGCVHKK